MKAKQRLLPETIAGGTLVVAAMLGAAALGAQEKGEENITNATYALRANQPERADQLAAASAEKLTDAIMLRNWAGMVGVGGLMLAGGVTMLRRQDTSPHQPAVQAPQDYEMKVYDIDVARDEARTLQAV